MCEGFAMRVPDQDTLSVWCSAAILGVLASFVLSWFAGIPFLYTVWVTVPGLVVLGHLGLVWVERRAGRDMARATTPIRTMDVPGLGPVRQLPEWWETVLLLRTGQGNPLEVTVHIWAGDEFPERQVRLISEFKERYAQLEPLLHSQIEAHSAGEPFNLEDMHVEMLADGEECDMEVCFGSTDGSNMLYIVLLKDCQVLDVYGAD
jgi:hypothetical protein